MKTVILNSGDKAITVKTTTYIHRSRMIDILVDLVYHERIEINSGKAEIMEKIRNHLFSQGISTYPDWYEDTDATPIMNELYKPVTEWVDRLFTELINEVD